MKISVYVTHYKFINLLKLQYEGIKRFCKEDVEYIVINNGVDDSFVNMVSDICKELSLKEIKIKHLDNRILYTAMDHKTALQHCYDNYISKDDADIRVVMDSDIIPFNSFSFIEMLGDGDIAGIKMYLENSIYIASFISIFSKNVKFDNFNLRVNVEFDSGLPMTNLVKVHKTTFLKHTAPMQEKEAAYVFRNAVVDKIKPYDSRFGVQFIEGSLLHYYRGSSWDSGDMDFYKKKTEFIEFFLQNVNLYDIYLDDNVNYDLAHMDSWLNKENYYKRLIF
jgi:hypothetical protein